MRQFHTPETKKSKRPKSIYVGNKVEKQELSVNLVGIQAGTIIWKATWPNLMPYPEWQYTLVIFPKISQAHELKETYIRMFIVELFLTSEI